MPFDRFDHAGNAIQSTLTADIGAADTVANIVAATGWPTGGSNGPFWIVIDAGVVGEEKCLVTSRSGNSLSGLLRGQDDTTAVVHSAGAVVKHIFSKTEADEANQVVVDTLGSIAAKGDLLAGTGANALGRLGAGTNGQSIVYDSTTATGLRARNIAGSDLTAGSVTNTQIAAGTITGDRLANDTLTEAKFSSAFWFRSTFSVTSGSGTVVIPHGAPFTPTFVQIMFTRPQTQGTGGAAAGFVVTSLDATNVTIKLTVGLTVSTAGLIDTGNTVAGTILSIA